MGCGWRPLLLQLCSGGKPRGGPCELAMAFRMGQELTQEVWDLLLALTSDLSAWRFLSRGPGLGMEEVRPPLSPKGLNAGCAPPVPSGTLLWSSRFSVTVGSSSCSGIPSPLSPRPLNVMSSVQESWAHLRVVGCKGVATCSWGPESHFAQYTG